MTQDKRDSVTMHILNLLYTASVESTCLYLYPIKSGVSRKEVFQHMNLDLR